MYYDSKRVVPPLSKRMAAASLLKGVAETSSLP